MYADLVSLDLTLFFNRINNSLIDKTIDIDRVDYEDSKYIII
jgi:hypothetical protein